MTSDLQEKSQFCESGLKESTRVYLNICFFYILFFCLHDLHNKDTTMECQEK